ncbi:MAG: indole-3-glycerol-phosphate synthase TrpC, partial [Acidimicrobiales bacterium]
EVDDARAATLARRIPPGEVAVAESGGRGADDARRLADAGFDAVLVGEGAVTAADRAAAVHALCGHRVAARGRRDGE